MWQEIHYFDMKPLVPPTPSRRRNMRRVKARDTQIELRVRRALHQAGYRFRLHRRGLPGCPDVVLPRYKLAVWIHGCFWHGHTCAKGRTRPKTNAEFWHAKLDGNVARDEANVAAIRQLGWQPIIIWECSLTSGVEQLLAHLAKMKAAGRKPTPPPSLAPQ